MKLFQTYIPLQLIASISKETLKMYVSRLITSHINILEETLFHSLDEK
jgi:hypothetical protein